MTVLERLGFERRLERSLEPGAGMHAATFDDPKGGIGVDLHLNLLLCSRWPGADDGFWSRAEPLTLRSATASVPSPADHLLHTCLHGYRDNPGVTPIRWMVDAVKLLDRAGADFRWDVFLDMAHYTMVKTSNFNGVRLPSICSHDPATGVITTHRRFGYESYRDRLS